MVENQFAPESMKQRKGRTKLTIVDCFYFVATTISTVGCVFPDWQPAAAGRARGRGARACEGEGEEAREGVGGKERDRVRDRVTETETE